jgi:hypothetical protein
MGPTTIQRTTRLGVAKERPEVVVGRAPGEVALRGVLDFPVSKEGES